MFGIVFVFVMCIGFIFVGVVFIENFNLVFYLFGLVLLVMVGNFVRFIGLESCDVEMFKRFVIIWLVDCFLWIL